MARTASSTVTELESLIGNRGNVSVNSNNRALVQKWLTANGVRAVVAKSLPIKALEDTYNDLSDNMLTNFQSLDPAYGTGNDPETGNAYQTPANFGKIIEETKPMQSTTAPDVQDAINALMMALGQTQKNQGPSGLTEAQVMAMIKEHTTTPLSIKIKETVTTIPAGLRHKDFNKILKAVTCGNVALIGPAGSGKTTLAEQVAEALGTKFYFTGAIASEYKLTGFIDAHGRLIRTAFRDAYEHGGLFLFDEIDGSLPNAVLAFNAALANGHADFPDGSVKRHPDFYCMAAANTYWTGADRVYVGRNQLDGATLDRFIFVDLPYDETMERTLAGNDEWVNHVQETRRSVLKLKVRHIVSPRASIMGAKLLHQGISQRDVEAMVLYKGLDPDQVKKIKGSI